MKFQAKIIRKEIINAHMSQAHTHAVRITKISLVCVFGECVKKMRKKASLLHSAPPRLTASLKIFKFAQSFSTSLAPPFNMTDTIPP